MTLTLLPYVAGPYSRKLKDTCKGDFNQVVLLKMQVNYQKPSLNSDQIFRILLSAVFLKKLQSGDCLQTSFSRSVVSTFIIKQHRYYSKKEQ
jgi:hypothetical protein